MSIVDDRGRIGGRVNLIDAVAAVVILVLIPVAYGAYLLFRTPAPKLTSIEPTTLYQGAQPRIVVNGTNLRPFMRVAFNTIQGRTFLIGSTKYALVDLPDLDPGTYDVQLFDYMQEVHTLPKALTILSKAPIATVQIEVTGAFHQLPDAVAQQIKPGTRFPPAGEGIVAEVLSVDGSAPASMRIQAGDEMLTVPIPSATELRATLRVHCYTVSNPDGTLRCVLSGPVQPSSVIPDSNLALPGPQGWVSFQIAKVRAAGVLPPGPPPAPSK